MVFLYVHARQLCYGVDYFLQELAGCQFFIFNRLQPKKQSLIMLTKQASNENKFCKLTCEPIFAAESWQSGRLRQS